MNLSIYLSFAENRRIQSLTLGISLLVFRQGGLGLWVYTQKTNTFSSRHIALYSALRRQNWAGLRPHHRHRSTLIAFRLPVHARRAHLKYSHTETLCTCFKKCLLFESVCVNQDCRKFIPPVSL